MKTQQSLNNKSKPAIVSALDSILKLMKNHKAYIIKGGLYTSHMLLSDGSAGVKKIVPREYIDILSETGCIRNVSNSKDISYYTLQRGYPSFRKTRLNMMLQHLETSQQNT